MLPVRPNDYIFILGLIQHLPGRWPAAVYHSSSLFHVCPVHLHCFPCYILAFQELLDEIFFYGILAFGSYKVFSTYKNN